MLAWRVVEGRDTEKGVVLKRECELGDLYQTVDKVCSTIICVINVIFYLLSHTKSD